MVRATLKALVAFWLTVAWSALTCLWSNHRVGRMMQWGFFSLFLYGLILCGVWPLVFQSALTKGANINAGAFLGYWIDRTLFASFDARFMEEPAAISDMAKAARVLARGIVVAACVIGLSLGTTA